MCQQYNVVNLFNILSPLSLDRDLHASYSIDNLSGQDEGRNSCDGSLILPTSNMRNKSTVSIQETGPIFVILRKKLRITAKPRNNEPRHNECFSILDSDAE